MSESNAELVDHESTTSEALTFDDIDSLTDDRTDEQVVKEAVKEAAKTNKEVTEESSSRQSSEEASAKDNEGAKAESEAAIEQELIEEIKMLKGKHKENEYELAADTVFTQKVNGEEKEVSLQTLLNDFSGRETLAPRFTELDNEKKQFTSEKRIFEQDKQAVEGYINNFSQLIKEQKYTDAMQFLAELGGVNGLEFNRAIRTQILEKYGNIQNMTEEQRKVLEQQEEIEFLKRQEGSKSEQLNAEKARQETLDQLRQVGANHEMSLEKVEETFFDMQELRKEALKNGEITAEEANAPITVEDVNEYIQIGKLSARVSDILDSFKDDRLNQAVEDTLFNEVSNNPEWDDDQIKEIIQAFLDQENENEKSNKKVSKKAKAAAVNTAKPKPKPEPLANDQVLFFDDLDD
jgi:hypothetical protein